MSNTTNLSPELEALVKGITDANNDINTRYEHAVELRSHMEHVRDSETTPSLSSVVPSFVAVLQEGTPAFQTTSPEYAFRKALLDIILRLLYTDPGRFPLQPFFTFVLHTMRTDNEENASSCLKALSDSARLLKSTPAETWSELTAVYQELCKAVGPSVEKQFGAQDRPADTILASVGSFRVLNEFAHIFISYLHAHRMLPPQNVQSVLGATTLVLNTQVPAQKQAREDFEAMGGIWAGMAPSITNAQDYEDLLTAQSKLAIYAMYSLRQSPDWSQAYGDPIVRAAIRILQDMPLGISFPRKDIIAVFRSNLAPESRRTIVSEIDKLLDRRVLVGNSLAHSEALLGIAYSALADTLAPLWNDVPAARIPRIVEVYIRVLHDPYVPLQTHVAAVKLFAGLFDALPGKSSQLPEAPKIMFAILEAVADRVELGTVMYADAVARLTLGSQDITNATLIHQIEKGRPLQGSAYTIERPEAVVIHCREFFSFALVSLTALMKSLRKYNISLPDGAIMSRLLRSCTKSLTIFTSPGAPGTPVMTPEVQERLKVPDNQLEKLVGTVCLMFADAHPHTFQEIWVLNIDFIFQYAAPMRYYVLSMCQFLLLRDDTSSILLPIILKYLVDRLEDLGNSNEDTAALMVRAFRIAFQSVVKSPAKNQIFLIPYLTKIVMDSFPLASKSKRPGNYYHLVRALFRTMGMNITTMEALFNELVSILPELLECLNRQLNQADASTRDQIVELFLNIPVRLTNLLSLLTYLVRPLSLALRGTPELVTLGLRTLELCIDHLTADFLDPILDAEMRDIHEPLHNLLRAPASPHAVVVIRILGKLGGRNRKMLTLDPVLSYRPYTEVTTIAVPFEGHFEPIALVPGLDLAQNTLKRPAGAENETHKREAFKYIKNSLTLLMQTESEDPAALEYFSRCLTSLFDCLHLESLHTDAEDLLQLVSKHVLLVDARRRHNAEGYIRRCPSPLLAAYLDALPSALVRDRPSEQEPAKIAVNKVVQDLISATNASKEDVTSFLHQVASRFIVMCLEDPWSRKAAGCSGIKIMLELPDLGAAWVRDREFELVRTLFHVLKNLPSDLPEDIERVVRLIECVLRMSYEGMPPDADGYSVKLHHVISVLFSELPSQSIIVREAVQHCIGVASSITGKSPYDLLIPHRERGLHSLYTKPLRALPYSNQIGTIEAIKYCLSLTPPLPDVNEELLRLLQETIGLAAAEDNALAGRGNKRTAIQEINKLRVACIKLLTAAIPVTDFFTQRGPAQERVTTVFFKSLYSSNSEVQDAARDGLALVLKIQHRLPRDLLHNGLKPILTNLGDASKLTVQGLEGLAVLLGLLHSYFKVEVGIKLLDHFRLLADPQMLQSITGTVISENDDMKKLRALANVFHMLPSNASVYLEDLCNAIVNTEAHIDCFSPSPLSTPLARFLNRYPEEGATFFLRNMYFPRHLRTLRNVLQTRVADRFEREIAARAPSIMSDFVRHTEHARVIAGLTLCTDLADIIPFWLTDNPAIVEGLIGTWRHEPPQSTATPEARQKYQLILELLKKVLQESPRVDILFEIISFYSRDTTLELVQTTRFLYEHVAIQGSLEYRRNILARFVLWFNGESVAAEKLFFIRFIITPMLQVQATRTPKEGMLDTDFIKGFLRCLSKSGADDKSNILFSASGLFLVEILNLCSVILADHSYIVWPPTLTDVMDEDGKVPATEQGQIEKTLVQFIYLHTNSLEPIVKQAANVLAATFWKSRPASKGTPPEKFILVPFTGLLKPPEVENKKQLNDRGLDLIVDVLPRMQTNDGDQPVWAKQMRRLLAEETVGMSLTFTAYQLVVRHPDVFYPVRATFVPHMVYSINKLGYFGTGAQNPEAKALSMEMIEVIFDWEKKTASTDVVDDRMDVDEDMEDDAQSTRPWKMPLLLRENLVSYTVRLAVQLANETYKGTGFTNKALALIRRLLGPGGWQDVTVKLNYYARALEQADLTEPLAVSQATGAARVLQVVCADKDDEWYRQNGAVLHRLLRKGLLADAAPAAPLSAALTPIFERLFKIYPLRKEEEPSSPMAEFHDYITNTLSEASPINLNNIRPMVSMLGAMARADPESLSQFSTVVVKITQRLFREIDQSEPELMSLVVNLLEVHRASISYLGESKKLIWTAIGYIADRAKSVTVCNYVLDFARELAIQRHKESYPSMKEKAVLLGKFMVWDRMQHEKNPSAPGHPLTDRAKEFGKLFIQYLEVIYSIYVDEDLRRSELTARLESQFLVGCRSRDLDLRCRFIKLLDTHVPTSLHSRLSYILGSQGWEPLHDVNWIYLASYLLLGAVNADALISPALRTLTEQQSPLVGTQNRAQDLIEPLRHMLTLETTLGHDVWVALFPAAWKCLSRREQIDLTHHMIALLSKDYHHRQADARPNIIQSLLEGIRPCVPAMVLPPHLVKYLAKNYGAWYVSIEMLLEVVDYAGEDVTTGEIAHDALAELYGELAEEDAFYGLWRRRALHNETTVAIALEENGMWEQASATYEQSIIKAKSGNIPFTEPEYCLWEDHWVLAQEKLQQWDILHELGRNEGNHERMLEAAWHSKNWSENREMMEEHLSHLPETPTLRRSVWAAFLSLMKPQTPEHQVEINKHITDCQKVTLQKWNSLPARLSQAHVPLLQYFQQSIELQESVQIFTSLAKTNHGTLEKQSGELKLILGAWRERLPNPFDDISIWSDLVAWRKNVFHAINAVYLPIAQQGGQNGAGGNTSTLGYRGFHETAWIINRFAHVARKHELLDVCHTQLTSIYTLPNIEISEAFLKLREQARCHFLKPDELHAGLEVVNNTNLMYFSSPQKAEFFTLKGMFYAKQKKTEDANIAFGQAVQTDMGQARAWAMWGKFNDRLFKENKTDLLYGANAVSCYLQAAGLYKNGKSRPLLARVLWLLSVDDNSLTISRQFDQYKGEAAYWYWITFIPQLCLSVSHREVKQARYLLLNMARLFPQALFYTLRTTREDMMSLRKQQQAIAARANAANPAAPPSDAMDVQQTPQTSPVALHSSPPRGGAEATPAPAPAPTPVPGAPAEGQQPAGQRQSWEYIDEVVNILKTAFPLLVLSLETVCEQFTRRFKQTPEEEQYRIICILCTDAIQTFVMRSSQPDDNGQLDELTISKIYRMGQTIAPGPVKDEYENDFIKSKPTFLEYIRRLQAWRSRYEKDLDARPKSQSLDLISHFLTEYQHGKFDDIEVPGQYTETKDTNQHFVRIQKFRPKFDNCRTTGWCYRRITIIGSDYSETSFAVRAPAHRHWRREDRLMQIFRTFNVTLNYAKETRKRNIAFTVPVAVQINANLRLEQDDASHVYMSDIFDQFCESKGLSREEPMLASAERTKQTAREFRQVHGRPMMKEEFQNTRIDLFMEIGEKMVPDTILTNYMVKTMNGASEVWMMRKQFTLQLAAVNFMTYIFCLAGRNASRFSIARDTGRIIMHELTPSMAGPEPVYSNNETVPFRFTPNMQRFVGPIFTEGLLTSGMMAIGRALTDPEDELEQQLCLFSRDEVLTWLNSKKLPMTIDVAFRMKVEENSRVVVDRARALACTIERQQQTTAALPQHPSATSPLETVQNLIAHATNITNLVKMTEIYNPWF